LLESKVNLFELSVVDLLDDLKALQISRNVAIVHGKIPFHFFAAPRNVDKVRKQSFTDHETSAKFWIITHQNIHINVEMSVPLHGRLHVFNRVLVRQNEKALHMDMFGKLTVQITKLLC